MEGNEARLAQPPLHRNDKPMAALICRAAKDHIDYCKGTHQDWVNLTADIVQLDQELDTNQHQEGGNA